MTAIDPVKKAGIGTTEYALPGAQSLNSWNGGIQGGHNWVVSPTFLVGLEVDFTLMDLGDPKANALPVFPLTPFTTAGASMDWMSTARVRAGWLATSSTLIYATGGLALTSVEQFHVIKDTSVPAQVYTGSNKEMVTGFTVGGGVEFALSASITFKAEYLFVRLDTPQARTTSFDLCGSQCTFLTGGNSMDLNSGRVGVNYRF